MRDRGWSKNLSRTAVLLAALIPTSSWPQSDVDLRAAYCAGVLKQMSDQNPAMPTTAPDAYSKLSGTQQHLQRYFYARGFYDSSNSKALSRLMAPIAQGRVDQAELARSGGLSATGACMSRCSDEFSRTRRAEPFNRCVAICISQEPPTERRITSCLDIDAQLPF